MCTDDQHGGGSFESYTALDTDDCVADVHIAADAVSCSDLFHLLDSSDLVFEYLTVDSMDLTLFKFDTQFFATGLFHLFQVSTFG